MLNGKRLREARNEQNLSAEELGKLVGVSKSAISLYESEKRNPKVETLIELMYALGVSADYLLNADVFVEISDNMLPKYQMLTKEEMIFINELRKDKIIYETLLTNPKEGMKIIKKKF